MTTARKSKAPITVPAMAPIEAPPEAGSEELADGAALEDVAVLVGWWDAAGCVEVTGDANVEEGERPFRHDRSSESATTLTSELPPCRPSASTIMNRIEVPCSTFVVQENWETPAGGCRTKGLPDGIMP